MGEGEWTSKSLEEEKVGDSDDVPQSQFPKEHVECLAENSPYAIPDPDLGMDLEPNRYVVPVPPRTVVASSPKAIKVGLNDCFMGTNLGVHAENSQSEAHSSNWRKDKSGVRKRPKNCKPPCRLNPFLFFPKIPKGGRAFPPRYRTVRLLLDLRGGIFLLT